MNYLKFLHKDWHKSHKWPKAIRDAFYKKHMNNQERFKVTVFFLANGFGEKFIRSLYAQKFNFDKSAWRQLDFIFKAYPTSNWTAWNIDLNKSI